MNLGPNWPLHGARDTAQLNRVLTMLEADAKRDAVNYAEIAAGLSVPRETVAEIARWYQSLWMRP